MKVDAEKVGRAAESLYVAVCQAVTLLNCAPEVARCAEGREARDLLRQALVEYANTYYMDEPAPEHERAAVAAKHQRPPRVKRAQRRVVRRVRRVRTNDGLGEEG